MASESDLPSLRAHLELVTGELTSAKTRLDEWSRRLHDGDESYKNAAFSAQEHVTLLMKQAHELQSRVTSLQAAGRRQGAVLEEIWRRGLAPVHQPASAKPHHRASPNHDLLVDRAMADLRASVECLEAVVAPNASTSAPALLDALRGELRAFQAAIECGGVHERIADFVKVHETFKSIMGRVCVDGVQLQMAYPMGPPLSAALSSVSNLLDHHCRLIHSAILAGKDAQYQGVVLHGGTPHHAMVRSSCCVGLRVAGGGNPRLLPVHLMELKPSDETDWADVCMLDALRASRVYVSAWADVLSDKHKLPIPEAFKQCLRAQYAVSTEGETVVFWHLCPDQQDQPASASDPAPSASSFSSSSAAAAAAAAAASASGAGAPDEPWRTELHQDDGRGLVLLSALTATATAAKVLVLDAVSQACSVPHDIHQSSFESVALQASADSSSRRGSKRSAPEDDDELSDRTSKKRKASGDASDQSDAQGSVKEQTYAELARLGFEPGQVLSWQQVEVTGDDIVSGKLTLTPVGGSVLPRVLAGFMPGDSGSRRPLVAKLSFTEKDRERAAHEARMYDELGGGGKEPLPTPSVVAFREVELGSGQEMSVLILEHVGRVSFVPSSQEELHAFARQLLDATCRLHAAGLAHLDIKPKNVAVDHRGASGVVRLHVRLLDLDVAEPLSSDERFDFSVGTRGYMAPEVAECEDPSDDGDDADDDGDASMSKEWSPLLADAFSVGKTLQEAWEQLVAAQGGQPVALKVQQLADRLAVEKPEERLSVEDALRELSD